MTEAEWLACQDVTKLLKRTGYRPNGRKIRLLICEWCRRRWAVLDERYRQGIEIAERFADGLVTVNELTQAREMTRLVKQLYGASAAYARQIQYTNASVAFNHLAYFPYDVRGPEIESTRALNKRVQIAILRDIFGNPFHPVAFSPEWQTSTAVSLAQQMYESRDFSPMPILADALQDAGCDSADVLDHCRAPDAVHVRGCWVVDLVLGKS